MDFSKIVRDVAYSWTSRIQFSESFASCHCCEMNFDYPNWLSTRTCGAWRSLIGLCSILLAIAIVSYYCVQYVDVVRNSGVPRTGDNSKQRTQQGRGLVGAWYTRLWDARWVRVAESLSICHSYVHTHRTGLRMAYTCVAALTLYTHVLYGRPFWTYHADVNA